MSRLEFDDRLKREVVREVQRPRDRRWRAWVYFVGLAVAAVMLGLALSFAGSW